MNKDVKRFLASVPGIEIKPGTKHDIIFWRGIRVSTVQHGSHKTPHKVNHLRRDLRKVGCNL